MLVGLSALSFITKVSGFFTLGLKVKPEWAAAAMQAIELTAKTKLGAILAVIYAIAPNFPIGRNAALKTSGAV